MFTTKKEFLQEVKTTNEYLMRNGNSLEQSKIKIMNVLEAEKKMIDVNYFEDAIKGLKELY